MRGWPPIPCLIRRSTRPFGETGHERARAAWRDLRTAGRPDPGAAGAVRTRAGEEAATGIYTAGRHPPWYHPAPRGGRRLSAVGRPGAPLVRAAARSREPDLQHLQRPPLPGHARYRAADPGAQRVGTPPRDPAHGISGA